MSVLAELHYDAIGVGETDLRIGKDQFFTEAEKAKLCVVDARPEAPKAAVPFVIKNVDGVKVGIVSFGAVLPEDSGNEYARRKAMFVAYKAAREKSDYLIVLDQATVVNADWLDRNGKRLGVPDLVVQGVQHVGIAQPTVIGKTQIVPTSMQGKMLGVVDIEIASGADPKVTWNRNDLNETVVEDPKTRELVQTFMMKGVSVPPVPASVPGSPSGTAVPVASFEKPYYSPTLCKTCHVKEYEDWAKSRHARAIKTLVDQKRMVPECLPCHSEEYRRMKSVAIPPDDIGGVECATCHIDALPHGLERAAVATKTKVNTMSCLSCHTQEHSPKYNEQAYFPKVTHPAALAGKAASAPTGHPQ